MYRKLSYLPLAWLLAVLAGAWILCLTSSFAETPAEAPANRLVDAGSPYLLQHAHNPVDWYPWGKEAIDKAKRENKLIFLSVGYSTCYWCHVAERTIYAKPEIAALMNKWFVNIKVDREERPDIDETYMLARQLLTGAGGWPNNVFLTPDLKPFFAGSYFPPEDRDGRRGFPSILRLIYEDWKADPANIEKAADKVHAALYQMRDSGKPLSLLRVRPDLWLAAARDHVLPNRDEEHGGFDGGGGTKFPQSPLLGLLLADYRLNGTTASLQAATEILNAIAFGGIHDQLGGGVHRYSTEPTWSVPHFEKMLYDNAQLLRLYTEYFVLTQQPLARAMATDIAGYLAASMTAPDGGFYTAEDADIDGKEGQTYVWTKPEIVTVLGEADAEKFFELYELTPLPEDLSGPGVIRIRQARTNLQTNGVRILGSIAELAPMRAKLLEIRNQRPQSARDDKNVVSLNGLAIEALARAGKVFDNPEWIDAAKRAGTFLWAHAYDEKSRSLSRYVFKDKAYGNGFLDDYALLGLGFIELSEATGDPVWRTRAEALAANIATRFVKANGAVSTTTDDETLIIPAVDAQDHDTPSGTSAAYALLAELGQTNPRDAETANSIIMWMAPKLQASPDGWPSFVASAAALAAPTGGASKTPSLDTALHVKATAHGVTDGTQDQIVVTLNIDPGYHINANPASLDYLIPTTVRVPAVEQARVAYPAGRLFKPKFFAEGILVYEDKVTIAVDLPKGTLDADGFLQVEVEAQACTDAVCLPPATIPVKPNSR
ncbi:MAG: DUF255 domain-containing protein [Methyloceanibacter sp.]